MIRRKVCLDLTALEMLDRNGGIGRYCASLFAAMRPLQPPFDLYALTASDGAPVPADDVDLAALMEAPLRSVNRHRFQRRLLAPWNLRKMHLFHSTTVTALPARTRTVATVYDTIALDDAFPGDGPSAIARRAKAQILERTRLSRPQHLIAISETTKAAVCRWSGRPSEDVSVTPLGLDHGRFHPTDPREARAKYGLPQRWIVSVGSDHYRKNQALAFAAWRRSGVPDALVLVGKALYGDTFQQLIRQALKDRVAHRFYWLQNVDDADLPGLYSGATCAIAPSRSEGFGLTLIEAMACATPVLASDQSAYREVGGSAARFFVPSSEEQLATLIGESKDMESRAMWVERGLAHARRFTWRACAEQTIAVYDRLLRQR
jgi:glycosyltransferase involved in cell wall biosynthesis